MVKYDLYGPEVTRGNPLGLSIYTFLKMKDRRVKQFSSGWGRGW
jgi:hypothetical protein